MNDLFNYVHIENVFSKSFCHNAIEKINSLSWNPHTWYTSDRESVDIKDFMTTYSPELQESMKENIFKFMISYIHKIGTTFPLHESTEIRFNIYTEGTEMLTHVDHIHSIFDGSRKGIPILSMLGVLNDDYEGGEFILCGKEIKLNSGDAIIFPSVFLYPHSVNRIKKGTRYSWVLWNF